MTREPISKTLHTYITDYVENTMQQDLKEVFEQYIQENPDLSRYVEQVRQGHRSLDWTRRVTEHSPDSAQKLYEMISRIGHRSEDR